MRLLGLTLGNWRAEPTRSTGLTRALVLEEAEGVHVFSARCCGMKGLFAGARHSWISIFDGSGWSTVEMTDAETLSLQHAPSGEAVRWECFGQPSKVNKGHCPFLSDRAPDGLWFGQAPRLEASFVAAGTASDFLADIEHCCDEYRFKNAYSLLDNNCSKFLSYLLWRNRLVADSSMSSRFNGSDLIGFRPPGYWRSVYRLEPHTARGPARNIAACVQPRHFEPSP